MSKIKSKYLDTGTTPGQVNDQAIPSTYTPTNYTPVSVGTENVDKISAHLKGIDDALTTAGGTKVTSLNTKTGDLTIEAGTNVTIDNTDPDKIIISSTGGSGEIKYTQSLTETTQELSQPVLDISNSETSAKVEYTVKRVLPPEGVLYNFDQNSAIYGGIYRSNTLHLYGTVGVGSTKSILKSTDKGQTFTQLTPSIGVGFIPKSMFYSLTQTRYYIILSTGALNNLSAMVSTDGTTFTQQGMSTGVSFAASTVLSTTIYPDNAKILVIHRNNANSDHYISFLNGPTSFNTTTINGGSLPADFSPTGAILSSVVYSDPYFVFLVQDGKLFSLSNTTLTRIFPSDTQFGRIACKPGVSAVALNGSSSYAYYNGSSWSYSGHSFSTIVSDIVYAPDKDVYIVKDQNNTMYVSSDPSNPSSWVTFTPKDSEGAETTNVIVYGDNTVISHRHITTQTGYRVYEGVEQRKVIQSGSFRAIADVGYTPIITSEESGGDDVGVSFSATQDVNDIMVEATLVDENQLSSEIKYTIKKL